MNEEEKIPEEIFNEDEVSENILQEQPVESAPGVEQKAEK